MQRIYTKQNIKSLKTQQREHPQQAIHTDDSDEHT